VRRRMRVDLSAAVDEAPDDHDDQVGGKLLYSSLTHDDVLMGNGWTDDIAIEGRA